jgi:DNA polymerase-4
MSAPAQAGYTGHRYSIAYVVQLFSALAMTLRALLIDFNSYFASVEQQVEPRLRGRPVAVVPMLADTTCCIAASYEAKRYGVKTLTKVADAKRLCPDIVLVTARHALYVDFHHRALKAIDEVIPIDKVLSIDEMACTLTPRWQTPEAARALALEIKRTIETRVGTCLKTSIGIGPNTFIAKQASNMQKPDGLTLIEADALPQALYRLGLEDLTGIGPRMLERLHRYGIRSVEQLCRANRDQMLTIWGGIGGAEFYAKLRGEAVVANPIRNQSISHSHVLSPDMRHPEAAYAVLHRLTQKAAMRLRKAQSLATGMEVALKSVDGTRWQTDARLPATQHTADFLHALDALWQRRPQRLGKLLQVAMTLQGLSSGSQQSGFLFQEDPRQQALDQALDALNLRFGKSAVYFGGAHPAQDRGGMAIAFNHIPDPDTES